MEINKDMKKDGISCVFFDLDGTLLTENKTIQKSTLAYIRELQKKIPVFLISGRSPALMKLYAHDLHIEDFLISFNGAYACNISQEKCYFHKPMEKEKMQDVLAFLKQYDCSFTIFTDSCAYGYHNDDSYFEQYNKMAKVKKIPLAVYQNFISIEQIHEPVYKLITFENKHISFNDLFDHMKKETKLQVTSSKPHMLDVSQRGVTKGSAIKECAEQLQIPCEQICVVGDYENDISMFQVSAYSIAMGQASENVKQHAAFITSSNEENGIVNAISQYIEPNLRRKSS